MERSAVYWTQCGLLNTVRLSEHSAVYWKQWGLLNTVRFTEHSAVYWTHCGLLNTVRLSEHSAAYWAQCGLLNTVRFTEHQHSLLSNKSTKFSVLLERGAGQYIIFFWHFLTNELSEKTGRDCRVTWRDIAQEKRLHKQRCENTKFFVISS